MFKKISDRIYFAPCDPYSDRPNIGYIKGSQRALLFEAGSSATHVAQMQADLKDLGLPLPSVVVISHWHWDHSFGLHAWDSCTIAGAQSNAALRRMQQWKWDGPAMENRIKTGEDIQFCNDMICREYPDPNTICIVPAQIEFSDTLSVDLGDITCQFFHVRGPHSEDSVVCFVPEESILFLGDSNGKDMYGMPWQFDIRHEDRLVETLQNIPYDMSKTLPYVEFLKTLPFSLCIDGHSGVLTRDTLFETLP